MTKKATTENTTSDAGTETQKDGSEEAGSGDHGEAQVCMFD